MKQLKKFQKKYNVGVLTFSLLVILAIQNNVLAAISLFPGI